MEDGEKFPLGASCSENYPADRTPGYPGLFPLDCLYSISLTEQVLLLL